MEKKITTTMLFNCTALFLQLVFENNQDQAPQSCWDFGTLKAQRKCEVLFNGSDSPGSGTKAFASSAAEILLSGDARKRNESSACKTCGLPLIYSLSLFSSKVFTGT